MAFTSTFTKFAVVLLVMRISEPSKGIGRGCHTPWYWQPAMLVMLMLKKSLPPCWSPGGCERVLYGVYGPEDADTVLCWYVPYRSELSSRFGVPCHTNQTSMRHIVKASS